MSKGMHTETIKILERGLELINQVAYKVSLRWLFYRLLQEGLYSEKDDYKKYVQKMSMARHKELCGWRPDSLSDETRKILYHTYGSRTVAECVKDLIPSIVKDVSISLDHFYHQEEFVILLYEARAMTQQFEHYTEKIDLVPFGGDVSIPIKYECGQYIQKMHEYYEKPVTILYFGDKDDKGEQIYETGMRHIQKWCNCPIEHEWCGLTAAQVKKYNVPEDPARPGKYQWEAVDDPSAAKIIQDAISPHVDADVIAKVEAQSQKQQKIWQTKIEKALEPLKPKTP